MCVENTPQPEASEAFKADSPLPPRNSLHSWRCEKRLKLRRPDIPRAFRVLRICIRPLRDLFFPVWATTPIHTARYSERPRHVGLASRSRLHLGLDCLSTGCMYCLIAEPRGMQLSGSRNAKSPADFSTRLLFLQSAPRPPYGRTSAQSVCVSPYTLLPGSVSTATLTFRTVHAHAPSPPSPSPLSPPQTSFPP